MAVIRSAMLFKVLLILTLRATCVEAFPPYPGTQAQVSELINYYFTRQYNNKILAFILFRHGISLSYRTLRRMLKRLSLSRRQHEPATEDIVREIMKLREEGYVNLGYRSMWRLLNCHSNVRVTQETVRLALRVIDENAVHLRTQHRLQRRLYHSRGPNFCIHIDGYDKLKPFGIAIHGAIDGFSRKILWMEAGPSHNDPRYIAKFYVDFLKKFARLPRVVRADRGSENVYVRDIQVALRYDHLDAMKGGKSFLLRGSVSNQRIERIWETLMTHFTQFWRDYFNNLGERGLFSDCDQAHIETIRFCYLPIIKEQLKNFVANWNSHRLRRQRHLQNETGIPNILYHMPGLYGYVDQSLPLPVYINSLDDVVRQYTAEFPVRGCSSDFLEGVRHITGGEPIPGTLSEAENLYLSILQVVDSIGSPN